MDGDIFMDKDNLRVIPKKNYVILGIVFLVSILLLYYFYLWVDAYNETKLNKPIMNKYLEVINYNELENYLIESPDAIIYVSVLEDKRIREFEKSFKIVFRKHEIDNNILYLNITDELKDKKKIKEMQSKYYIGNKTICDVPSILVFDNSKLRTIYNIAENDYDVDRVKEFLDNITFSSEDEING